MGWREARFRASCISCLSVGLARLGKDNKGQGEGKERLMAEREDEEKRR